MPSDTANHEAWFAGFFDAHFSRLHRFLNRFSGDADLASEMAQEALLRLYRRRPPPTDPEAWVFTVAMNLTRNARSKRARRRRLLTAHRSLHAMSDPPSHPGQGGLGHLEKARVRAALDALSDRDRTLLLLRAEGLKYHEIAAAAGVKETSVGTLLKRAKDAFRKTYEGASDAPE